MLHLVHMIDRLEIGGAQKLLVTFASAAQGHNIDLTMVSLYRDHDTTIPDDLRALGVRVLHFPARKLLDPLRLWRLTRFLGRTRIDVLQTHLTHANVVGIIAARLAQVPVVATLHSTQTVRRRYHAIRQRLETWLLRYGAQRVVAVGHTVAEAHQPRLGSKPVDIIPNAVAAAFPLSAAQRTACRTELVGDPLRPLLISVGRLVRSKGYIDLLTAFAKLRETHLDVALVIVGAGELYPELAAQITAHRLDGHAILLGARNDVPRLLAASDIYVSASLWEGLPVAVLEAMAAGLPVVATRAGDVPQVMIEGTGLLVSAQAPDQLAGALGSMLDDPVRRRVCGAAARDRVRRCYSPAAWVTRLMALYTELGAVSSFALHRQKESKSIE